MRIAAISEKFTIVVIRGVYGIIDDEWIGFIHGWLALTLSKFFFNSRNSHDIAGGFSLREPYSCPSFPPLIFRHSRAGGNPPFDKLRVTDVMVSLSNHGCPTTTLGHDEGIEARII